MCQHDFQGRRLFQHRNCDKWDLHLCNLRVKGFWFEEECRDFVRELQKVWDGGMRRFFAPGILCSRRTAARPVTITAVMISCPERHDTRERTLTQLAKTDWGEHPVHLQVDEERGSNRRRRQTECSLLALKSMLGNKADYVLFLEDDLEFNNYLRHNLHRWPVLTNRIATLASVYNPRLREIASDPTTHSRVVSAKSVYGSQAFLISSVALNYIVRNWESCRGMQDIRISRLASRLGKPILYHAPSLVQHVGKKSTWGTKFHRAIDFDPDWRA